MPLLTNRPGQMDQQPSHPNKDAPAKQNESLQAKYNDISQCGTSGAALFFIAFPVNSHLVAKLTELAPPPHKVNS
jgi:hypothetical protein